MKRDNFGYSFDSFEEDDIVLCYWWDCLLDMPFKSFIKVIYYKLIGRCPMWVAELRWQYECKNEYGLNFLPSTETCKKYEEEWIEGNMLTCEECHPDVYKEKK